MFFGREDKVDELIFHLDAGAGQPRSVTVIGSSGAGKSSLVRAGVIPRLRRDADSWLVVPVFTPGERPVAALARALIGAGAQGDRLLLQERLEHDPQSIAELVLDLSVAGDRRRAVLLVIDQFEELVSLASAAERERFIAVLGAARRAHTPL